VSSGFFKSLLKQSNWLYRELEMKDILRDIQNKLSNHVYKNEEHVRLSLVSRILNELGWNLWDPNEVNSEFTVIPHEDQSRIDLALFSTPYFPSVFIEIKAVGKLEGNIDQIERQLRDYNRNNTALFSIITDGRKWRFYYSQTGGEFSQKCFRAIDILDDNFDDVELAFYAFLSKGEITNGSAEREAQNYLRLNQKQRAMEDALSEARRMILEPPYPSLPQAIVQVVSEAGFPISETEASQFISKFGSKKSPVETSPPQALGKLAEKEPIDKKRIEITLRNIYTPTRYALIPLPKEYRDFFPGYKTPFILVTDIGEIRTKVTSARKGTEYGDPEAGNYIYGGLRPWYDKHNDLKEGDELIIEMVEPKKRYRLKVKSEGGDLQYLNNSIKGAIA